MSKYAAHRVIALIIVAVVLGLDQASKEWAVERLRYVGSTLVLPGPIDLTLVFNRSNAFGLMPAAGELSRWGLAALNLTVAAVLIWIVARRSTSGPSAAGFAFIIAGAIGNALDRMRFGAVLDFFDASKIGFIWVFNVADASIDVGIGLSLLAAFMPRSDSGESSSARG